MRMDQKVGKRVYVLGAGASVDAGVPLLSRLRTELFQRSRIEQKLIPNFDYSRELQQLEAEWHADVDSEQFVDTLIHRANEERIGLVEALRRILNWYLWDHRNNHLNNKRDQDYLNYFVTSVLRPEDLIISMNYDLCLELTGRQFQYEPRLDQWYTILRPHGAANLYRDVPGTIYMGGQEVPRSRNFSPVRINGQTVCWSAVNYLFPPIGAVIISPGHGKGEEARGDPYFGPVWETALEAIKQAQEVIFVGYSLLHAQGSVGQEGQDELAVRIVQALREDAKKIVGIIDPSQLSARYLHGQGIRHLFYSPMGFRQFLSELEISNLFRIESLFSE